MEVMPNYWCSFTIRRIKEADTVSFTFTRHSLFRDVNNGDTKKELLKYTKCSIAEKYLIYLIPNYSHLCIDIVLGSCLSVKDIPKSTKYSPSLQEKQNYYKIDQGYTDYQQPYLELSV